MPRPAHATDGWSRRTWAAAPKSLLVLLAIIAIVGGCWALLTPPWQTPDSVAHFAYTQSLAQSFRLPGDKHRLPLSSAQKTADDAVGASRGAFYPQASPPDWNRASYRAYLRVADGPNPPSESNGGGPNPASTNPPLYYLYASAGYLLDAGGTAFGQVYAIQLWGLLLLLGTTIGTWLLAGETFGRRRSVQSDRGRRRRPVADDDVHLDQCQPGRADDHAVDVRAVARSARDQPRGATRLTASCCARSPRPAS